MTDIEWYVVCYKNQFLLLITVYLKFTPVNFTFCFFYFRFSKPLDNQVKKFLNLEEANDHPLKPVAVVVNKIILNMKKLLLGNTVI